MKKAKTEEEFNEQNFTSMQTLAEDYDALDAFNFKVRQLRQEKFPYQPSVRGANAEPLSAEE